MPDGGGKLTMSDKDRDKLRKKDEEEQDRQPASAKCPKCWAGLTEDKDCKGGIWYCPYCGCEF